MGSCFSSNPVPDDPVPAPPPTIAMASVQSQTATQAVLPITAQPESPASTFGPRVPQDAQMLESSNPRPTPIINPAEDLSPRLGVLGNVAVRVGGFSEVKMGELAPLKEKVAIKSFRIIAGDPETSASPQEQDSLIKEGVCRWVLLNNPYIVECLGFAVVGKRPSLVSRWYENGNALEYLKKGPPKSKRKAMIGQVAQGLAFLHGWENPVVHGRVRLSNIMIGDDGKAMITDFGLAPIVAAYKTGRTTADTAAVGYRYDSPELFEGLEGLEGLQGTVKSDVYSFACLVLEILTGKAPFHHLDAPPLIMFAKTQGQKPSSKHHPELEAADPLWKLLEKCWERLPQDRPTMQQVVKELTALGYGA